MSICIILLFNGAAYMAGQVKIYILLFPLIDTQKIKQATDVYTTAKLDEKIMLVIFLAIIYFLFLDWISGEVVKHRNDEKPK